MNPTPTSKDTKAPTVREEHRAALRDAINTISAIAMLNPNMNLFTGRPQYDWELGAQVIANHFPNRDQEEVVEKTATRIEFEATFPAMPIMDDVLRVILREELRSLRNPENSIEKEQGRWQGAIYAKIRELLPGARIDGSACDSGDPLDITLHEVEQGIGAASELRSLRAEPEWRPIESAPKDVHIIVACAHGVIHYDAWWSNGDKLLSPGWVDHSGWIGATGVTHWRPLPTPPQV